MHTALGVGLAWVLPWVPASLGAAALDPAPAGRGRAAVRPGGRGRRSSRASSRAFWRFTAPRSASSIAQLVLQRADIILIGALKGPRDAAIYTAATRFLVFGQLLSNSIGQTIQPKLAQLMVNDERDGARQVYQVATVWLVLSSWPIYLLSAVFAEQLLRVFGRGYGTGAVVIVVLSLVSLVATASGTVDVVLGMAGRASWTMINSFGALAVDLVLNLLLIPRIGILGAALAWAAAIAINNLAPLTQLAVGPAAAPVRPGERDSHRRLHALLRRCRSPCGSGWATACRAPCWPGPRHRRLPRAGPALPDAVRAAPARRAPRRRRPGRGCVDHVTLATHRVRAAPWPAPERDEPAHRRGGTRQADMQARRRGRWLLLGAALAVA